MAMRVGRGMAEGDVEGAMMERMEEDGGEGARGAEELAGTEVRRSTMSVVPRTKTA